LQHISPQFTLQQEWRDRLQQEKQTWQNDLEKKVVHRAVDILPEVNADPMKVSTRHVGVGPLGVVGIALAAGLPSALLAWSLLGQPKPTTPPAVETPSFRYRVRFGYRDGKPFKELLDESGKVVKEAE
jgi:hypothetical protein